ncbi:hypothetical protein Q4595_15870 [Wenyingzhuangia sp. 1_MG-2023]|nr:hypothetical protein [Wenyingzhuangia sp. 1_MG-2023]
MPINHTSKRSQLTSKQFELIGKLMVEFSNLDYLLGTLLNRLLITPQFLGLTYTDQMMATKKIIAIENAIEIHLKRYDCRIFSEDILKQSLKIIREIKGFKSLRNKFAHYCWSRWSDEKIFGTQMTGKMPNLEKTNKDSITITNSELIKQYEKSYNLVENLEKILEQIPVFEENIELMNKTIK